MGLNLMDILDHKELNPTHFNFNQRHSDVPEPEPSTLSQRMSAYACNSVTPLLGISPKDSTAFSTDTRSAVLIVALFPIARRRR